jgi:hypothetical protein
MFKTILTTTLIAAGAFGLSACDVKKTADGNVTVPKYEVEKKQAGDVTLPKYDVTTPDVKVTTTEKTVNVPTIKAEEKTVELPKVEITTGKEKNKQGG